MKQRLCAPADLCCAVSRTITITSQCVSVTLPHLHPMRMRLPRQHTSAYGSIRQHRQHTSASAYSVTLCHTCTQCICDCPGPLLPSTRRSLSLSGRRISVSICTSVLVQRVNCTVPGHTASLYSRMLTHAGVCRRVLTYADVRSLLTLFNSHALEPHSVRQYLYFLATQISRAPVA